MLFIDGIGIYVDYGDELAKDDGSNTVNMALYRVLTWHNRMTIYAAGAWFIIGFFISQFCLCRMS